VTVSWADNSSTEFKFEVYRSDATVTMNGAYTLGNGGFAKIGDALANASEYFDATALPRTEATLAADGTVYAYKVVAVGAAGSSDIASANIGYTPTNPTAPSAPTGLAVTGTSGTQVALQWVDTSNNEVGFLIQRSVNGGAFAPLTPTTAIGAGLVNLPLNTTTFVDSGLAPNDMVSYQVASVNLAGTADCMAGAVVCTVSTVTNSAPTVNSVGVAATSANSVTLNWSLTQLLNADNQAITSYVITRTGGAGGQVTFAAAAADLSFPDTTAQGNSTYTYTVYAVNANGMAPVNGKSATSLQVTTPYAAVGTLAKPIAVASAAGVAPSSVSVIWSAATPADKYVLERSDGLNNTTGPWTTLTTVATPPVGGFPDATVAPLTSYTYRVTAYNGFGSPSQTSTADTTSVTTNASIVVLAPTLTSTVPNLTTGAVTLTWTDQATNETGFVVESSIDGGTTWTQVGAQVAPRTGTTGLTRTANVTVTAPATQFRVRALNLTAGVTTYSVGSNVVTLSTVLTAPGTPTAAIFSATRVTLSWADMSNNETSFQVWRSDTGAAAVQIGVVNRNAALGAATGGTAVTFNDNNNTTFNGVTSLLQLGHTYTYYVVAVNGNKTSAASGTVDVAFVAPAAPDALIALTAHNAGSTTRDTVTLNWAALPVGSNVTYTVQRIRPANLGGGTTTLLLNSTATTFIDPNVQRSATAAYTYQIRTNAGPLSSAYVPTVLIVN
jgi:fibronectin type 3 domain-containing protein